MIARRTRAGLAAVLAMLAMAGPLPAQNPWVGGYYPFFFKGPNEDLSLVVHYQYAQLADFDARVPYAGSVSVEGGINASGGRWLVGRFKAPLLWPNWRVYAEAGTVRNARYGYFGLGNDTEDTAPEGEPYYRRVRRTRYYARADLTRRVAGPLQATAAGALGYAEYSALPGQSRFLEDCDPTTLALRSVPGLRVENGECADDFDLVGRVALVLDTRDNEFTPTRGVLLEAGALAGTGGDGYGGVYGVAQGLVSPRFGTVLAARVLGRRLGEGAPLEARQQVFAWERSVPVVGGPESHRGMVAGRYAAREVILANVEIRQDILNFGDYGAITALGFFDAARARELHVGESDEMHLGGGFGLALRILRATILTFNWGWSGDGYQFAMGTGWAF